MNDCSCEKWSDRPIPWGLGVRMTRRRWQALSANNMRKQTRNTLLATGGAHTHQLRISGEERSSARGAA